MVEMRGTSRRRVAVLGAGPAGMTAAYLLSKDPNVEVMVFEADSRVGGMAKSIDLWGQRVDIGPHRFFSDDPRVNSIWLELMGSDYSMVSRLTRIYFDKNFYYYPLKIFNVLSNIGIIQAALCVLSYVKERLFPRTRDPKSFEDWVISRFGERLFKIFFKTYSEKLWGISCKDLDADFAAQRIKKLSLFEAILNALKFKNNQHKTLVDEFAYPHAGTGEVYERMAQKVVQAGGQLFLSRPVKGLWTDGNKNTLGIELLDGEFLGFDHVISSIPLNKLVLSIKESPVEVRESALKLKFRNTIIVYLEVEGTGLFPDQWLYVHDSKLQTGRVTNFRNWVPEICQESGNTILAMEYWCYDDEQKWQLSDSDLIQLGMKEIRETGLIENRRIIQGEVLRIPRCYPVYQTGYKESLSLVENYLSEMSGLQVIGRYGAFKYNNQDHSILMGRLAAENILFQAKHNLWTINTDYEYQEASKIENTGLSHKKTGTEE
ncbi:MAG: FAD-dependent oxidoreductase [Bdellovibrionota bacterium]